MVLSEKVLRIKERNIAPSKPKEVLFIVAHFSRKSIVMDPDTMNFFIEQCTQNFFSRESVLPLRRLSFVEYILFVNE